jgi:hypothetical protein
MVAPQQIIKKIKVRGFTYFTHTKLSSFTIRLALSQVWGFVFGIVCKLSVNIGKTIAKKGKPVWNYL